MNDIRILAAIGKSGQIGLNGELPWHDKSDLKWFKETTMGHACIVGPKTYEKMPKLPGRYVFIDNKHITPLEFLNQFCLEDRIVYIIGGAQTYIRWLPYSKKVYLGLIDYDGEADTFFPKLY